MEKNLSLINSNYQFSISFQKDMSYKLQKNQTNGKRNKIVQSMAYASLWSDGQADDHTTQQQLSLFVPIVV